MGELSGITPPHFDWFSDDLPTKFQNFKSYCSLIFKGPLASKNKEEQVTYLLLWLGQEGINVYETWSLTVEQKGDPNEIFKCFEKYFEPKINYRLNRFQLQKFKQGVSENIDQFMIRCRTQAGKCKFSTAELETRLIEQLIFGTVHKKVQEILLSKDETLKLDDAVDIARTFEATKAHMEAMGSTIFVDQIQKRQFKPNRQSTNNCNNCGLKFPHKGKCPAIGTKCNYCSKPNHWESVCRQRKAEYRGTSMNRTRPMSKSRNRKPQYRAQTPSYSSHADAVSSDTMNVHQITPGLENLNFDTIEIYNVNGSPVHAMREATATLDIEVGHRPATLKVKIDTGADGNILPLRIFKRMYPHSVDSKGIPLLGSTNPSNVKVTAYNGSPILHFGTYNLKCSYNGTTTDTVFYVVDAQGPAILGLGTSTQLKLVSLHCGLSTTKIVDKNDLRFLFPDRFEGIGKLEGDYHIVIDTEVPPVVHAPRRCQIQIQDDIKKELDDMIKLEVITPVIEPTDWVSSLTYAQKPNGRWRICLDPRDLNKAIKRSYHHTPTLDEITYKFSQSTVFSKLDARHGYWSIKLDEPSSFLTTFNSPFGRYRFTRLPFGLCVSQDIFQQKMDQILELCPGTVGISDDIGVFGKTEQEHDKNLLNLMKVAGEKGLVFNFEKCEIKKPSIKFFGLIFDSEGVHPDPDKIRAIELIKAPDSAKHLQEFLGIATYMAPFIPNLSTHTAPLRNLIKKDVEYVWTRTHDQAFQKIKNLICKQVTLSYFEPNKQTVIEVDSSLKGIGCVLKQGFKPVCFASKSFTETEQRYANIEREMLAVVYACEKFHTYVYGKSFVVESDHKPLEMIHLKNLSAAPPRLQRLLIRLQGYDVQIKYKPGKDMLLADALSRLNPASAPSIEVQEVILNFVQFSKEKISSLKKETDADPELNSLREVIFTGWPSKRSMLPKLLQKYWSYRDELSIENGLILKGDRIIIPPVLRFDILSRIHNAHQGVVKCQLRARTCVFWPNINRDIEDLVLACPGCQEQANSHPHEPLIQTEIPTRPWQVVASDLFFLQGEEYLILADYYSKFVITRLIPKGKSTSNTIIEIFKDIFSEYGIPEKLITDNGSQYASQVFKEFVSNWGLEHITSSPRYPQSNGFIERQVQIVKNTIYKAKQAKADVKLALLCLRATPIDYKLQSPAELLHGRKVRSNLPIKIANKLPDRDFVYDRFKMRQDIQKSYHDRNVKELNPLVPGQHVNIQDQDTRKWSPATVIATRPEPRSYEVQSQSGGIFRRNRRHLRVSGEKGKSVIFNNDSATSDISVTKVVPLLDNIEVELSVPPGIVNTESNIPTGVVNKDKPYITRSGRILKKRNILDL